MTNGKIALIIIAVAILFYIVYYVYTKRNVDIVSDDDLINNNQSVVVIDPANANGGNIDPANNEHNDNENGNNNDGFHVQIDLRPIWVVRYRINTGVPVIRSIEVRGVNQQEARLNGIQQIRILHPNSPNFNIISVNRLVVL